MRDMTTEMATALQGGEVQPVIVARLDIENDPVKAWSGPGLFAPTGTGDTALDGNTFDPAEGFVDITDIQEDQGTGNLVAITAKANDLDASLLRQIVRDGRLWIGRDAFLWLGLLEEEKNVVVNPTRIKTGVMVEMEIKRESDTNLVVVTIDVDLRNEGAAPFQILDHPRIWSSDTFATFMVRLSNKGARFTDRDIRKNVTVNTEPRDPIERSLLGLP